MIRIVRALAPPDIDQCLAIRHAVFVVEQGYPSGKMRDIYDSVAVHILARVNDLPVGCARAVISSTGTTAHISFIAVLKPFRQQGIGTRLLTALELSPEFYNIPTLFLDTSVPNLKFYKHHGYRASNVTFNVNGANIVVAQKYRFL